MDKIDFDVLKSYLVESKSHRWIQENILNIEAPERGGGYETMKILHAYDVTREFKGALVEYEVTENNLMGLLCELKVVSDEVENHKIYIEGATQVRVVNSYERDTDARKVCISHYGNVCQACSFDFYKMYGVAAQGYIEVHHLIPISSLKENYRIDPIRDLIPLCSNCHSVAHRKNPPYTVTEIKQMIAS